MSGFQINGIDIINMVATTGNNDDVSNFRNSFSSTSLASFPRTKFSPANCVISTSPDNRFDCYKVPTTFGDDRYETPTNTTGDWSGLAGDSWRWNGNVAAIGPANQGSAATGPQTEYSSLKFPNWCNKILIYSVGGGGGGGAKGGDNPSYNSGDGANGTNGLAVTDSVAVTPGGSYTVVVGGGGAGGAGTGNSQGAGAPGSRSYVSIGGTKYAAALGGVSGNQGTSAGNGGPGGDGNQNGALLGVTSSSNAASNVPATYPPTQQVVAARYNKAGIGSFGPGNINENNNTGNDTPGVSGGAGMVAIFFKNK